VSASRRSLAFVGDRAKVNYVLWRRALCKHGPTVSWEKAGQRWALTYGVRLMRWTVAAAAAVDVVPSIARPVRVLRNNISVSGRSVAEWLACWTEAQGLGSNRSRDAVG